jgi:transcriptional regulator with XRE-family HTH domain
MRTVTRRQLGERLADLRTKAGLTQAQVAAKLNIANETLSRLERGTQWTDFETFVALGRLYGVEWADMMAIFPGPSSGKRAIVQEVCDLLQRASPAEVELVRDIAEAVLLRRRRGAKGGRGERDS